MSKRWTIGAWCASLLALGLLVPERAAAIVIPCAALTPVSSTIPADAAGVLLTANGDRSGFAPRLVDPNGAPVDFSLTDLGSSYLLLDPGPALFQGTYSLLWTRTCGPGTNQADPVEVATPIEVSAAFVSPDGGAIDADLQKCSPDLQRWGLSWQPSPEIAASAGDYWFNWEVDGQPVPVLRGILIVATIDIMGTKWQYATDLRSRNVVPTVACAGAGVPATRTARLRLFHVPSAREVTGIEHTFDVSCIRCALPAGTTGDAAAGEVPLVAGNGGGCMVGATRPRGVASIVAFVLIGWHASRRFRRRSKRGVPLGTSAANVAPTSRPPAT
jgi:hypothetical protein